MKTLATNILNLTDARYFAARGVTWLHYHITSLDQLLSTKAIKEWVEGPKTLLSFAKDLTETTREQAITELRPEGVLDTPVAHPIIHFRSISSTAEIDGAADFYLVDGMDDSYNQWLEQSKVFLPALSIDFKHRDQLISAKIEGLAFAGSAEEEVGIKSFDELDGWLDWLDELSHQ